ncbi:MAG: hypothetical protein E7338_02240 [Clostridiales bacterium]|nr:hypothetical protein [Clostridiales bacterium]
MRKHKYIIIAVVAIVVLIVIAFLVNLCLFNALKNNKVNILEQHGVKTTEILKLEKLEHSPEQQYLKYTTFCSKTKFMYGIYSLGYKVHCLYDDGNKQIEYDLYEVDWARTYAEDESFYIFSAETLFETKHILVLDKSDKDNLELVWRDLGLLIDYQFAL